MQEIFILSVPISSQSWFKEICYAKRFRDEDVIWSKGMKHIVVQCHCICLERLWKINVRCSSRMIPMQRDLWFFVSLNRLMTVSKYFRCRNSVVILFLCHWRCFIYFQESIVKHVKRRELPNMGMLFLNLKVRRSHLVADSLDEVCLVLIYLYKLAILL